MASTVGRGVPSSLGPANATCRSVRRTEVGPGPERASVVIVQHLRCGHSQTQTFVRAKTAAMKAAVRMFNKAEAAAARSCKTCAKYIKPRWDCPTCAGTGLTPPGGAP